MSTASTFLDRAKTTTTEIIKESLTVKHKEDKCPSVTEGCVLLVCGVLVSRTGLTHICPDIFQFLFYTKYPEVKKAFSFLQTVASYKNKREKRSATSSLNKGSPPSEVHVSRTAKLHTATTD